MRMIDLYRISVCYRENRVNARKFYYGLTLKLVTCKSWERDRLRGSI